MGDNRMMQRTGLILGAVLSLAIAGHSQTSKNMTQLAKFQPPNVVSSSAGIWGHTDAMGREYALFTARRPGGVHVVDISTPAAPRHVSFHASTGNSIWQEVHSYRKTAYKVSQENSDGLQIIDLTPLDQGRPPVEIKKTTEFFKVAHTLYVDTTVTPARLFVAYENTDGIMIFTLENPQAPKLVKSIVGECHDMFARGNRLYASNQRRSVVTIYNITDVLNPVRIGTIDFNVVSPSKGEPGRGISHNTWPSDDNKVLFTTEETAGTTVKAFNITNPATPVLLGTYVGVRNIIAHNVYLKGSLMFVAHYTAGIRVVDVSDPTKMTEIAFHRPSTSTAEYGGTWGVYPWFRSGNIIHGDDVQGLFVEKIDVLPTSAKYRAEQFKNTIIPMGRGRIEVNLAEPGAFVMQILGSDGREVRTIPGEGLAGSQTLTVDLSSLSRGHYLARLKQGAITASAPLAIR